MKQKRSLLFLLVCSVLCANAQGREPDGTLGLVRVPNNGVPAIVTPGATFNAALTSKATLTLSQDGATWPLEVEWTRENDLTWRAACAIPQSLSPGIYALCAAAAEHTDCNARSVYVMEEIPEHYLIAHLTDTHIGTKRHPREDVAIIRDVIAAVNDSEAVFALITGDLTENGTPEQFQRFLNVLDECRLPTFVVPGNHDRQATHYEQFFGPLTYMFRFGPDGYLGFDTKDFMIADEMGPQDGLLHYYRRKLRPSRWSIGFTHRYDLTMGMRSQITLFVDDPLDYLIYGHYHREATDQDGIPWGHTSAIMTPAAINGHLRFIEVSGQGLQPYETVRAASTRIEQDNETKD